MWMYTHVCLCVGADACTMALSGDKGTVCRNELSSSTRD